MALIDQLFYGNYNGIPFLLGKSSTEFGRKTIIHQYPNKDYVYVEDMGKKLRVFNLTVTVTGDDYLINREALILALTIKGIGILTHPFYGVIPVTPLDFTVTEDPTFLGECVFEIKFQESKINIFPIVGDDDSIFNVSSLIEEIAPFLAGIIVTKFATTFKRNVADASEKNVKLNNSLQPTTPPRTGEDTYNTFKKSSNDFNDDRYKLIQDPTRFSTALPTLLNNYNELGVTYEDKYNLNANAYYVGRDDVPIKYDTAEMRERYQNRQAFNGVANATILMNMYSNAVSITYLDEDQLFIISSDLEEKYQYLMNNNNFDTETLDLLAQLRTSARKFFDKIKVSVGKIINIDLKPIPMTAFLYQYYEDFNNEDEIISLNDMYEITNINGNIKAITVQ